MSWKPVPAGWSRFRRRRAARKRTPRGASPGSCTAQVSRGFWRCLLLNGVAGEAFCRSWGPTPLSARWSWISAASALVAAVARGCYAMARKRGWSRLWPSASSLHRPRRHLRHRPAAPAPRPEHARSGEMAKRIGYGGVANSDGGSASRTLQHRHPADWRTFALLSSQSRWARRGGRSFGLLMACLRVLFWRRVFRPRRPCLSSEMLVAC